MSEAGGGRCSQARPTPEPRPPFSQIVLNWLLRSLMDLEERARGRRSRSTLVLRESILQAWEERDDRNEQKRSEGETQDGLSSQAASRASQRNAPRKKKRGGIVEALAVSESVWSLLWAGDLAQSEFSANKGRSDHRQARAARPQCPPHAGAGRGQTLTLAKRCRND